MFIVNYLDVSHLFSINQFFYVTHKQVHYHLKDLMTELQQTNLEKTLLAWCRQNSQVIRKNFSYVSNKILLNIIKVKQ